MSTTTPATGRTVADHHAAALDYAEAAAEALDAFDLARMADCGVPDYVTEGADALDTARRIGIEAAAEALGGMDPAEAMDATAEDLGTDGSIWQGIDGCAHLTYTSRTREAFHTLDGWTEDVSDWGAPENLDVAAWWALFSIMSRCAEAVAEHFVADYLARREDLAAEDSEDSED